MTTAKLPFLRNTPKKTFIILFSANSAIINEQPSHSRLNNCAMKKLLLPRRKTPHISRVKLWVKLLQYCSLSCLFEQHYMKEKLGM